MKNYGFLLVLCLLFAELTASTLVEPPQPSAEDFKVVLGTHTGALEYKDYSGGGMVKLSLVGVSYIKKDKLILEHMIYEGKVYRQKYEFDFKKGAVNMNGEDMTILENTFKQETNRKLVLSHRGKDGNKNRKCTFRYTLSYENDQFTIVKEVKFDDEQEYFKRNQYTLQKFQ